MAHSEHRQSRAMVQSSPWLVEEYEAGYKARFLDIAQYMTATPSWRAGWQEADRELTFVSTGRPFETTDNSGYHASFYGCGDQARVCKLPFEVRQTEDWKRSWITADIALGIPKRGEPR